MLVNIQPYISLLGDPTHIKIDYALFKKSEPEFTDLNNRKIYQNLFDAIYDATYVAIEKVVVTLQTDSLNDDKKKGGKNVKVTVSESGWPSKSGFSGKKPRNYAKKTITSSNDQKEPSIPGEEYATIENARTYYTKFDQSCEEGNSYDTRRRD
ncbi:hypothetical protein BVRB_4g073210 [Beta vulgaris subsp. vulgaris]|nr:hypothetical protein BVRB_4g073210 [Beta vulgaris subsp. vulgaris]